MILMVRIFFSLILFFPSSLAALAEDFQYSDPDQLSENRPHDLPDYLMDPCEFELSSWIKSYREVPKRRPFLKREFAWTREGKLILQLIQASEIDRKLALSRLGFSELIDLGLALTDSYGRWLPRDNSRRDTDTTGNHRSYLWDVSDGKYQFDVLEEIRNRSISIERRLQEFRRLVIAKRLKTAETYPAQALEDSVLGMRMEQVLGATGTRLEKAGGRYEVYRNETIWQDASPEASRHGFPSSSYAFLHQLFSRLEIPRDQSFKLVDFGSGFGSVGFYLAAFFPNAEFLGYELVGERVDECNRVSRLLGFWPRVRCVRANLASRNFVPERADYYYAYCPVNHETGAALEKKLKRLAESHDFTLLVKLRLDGAQPELWMKPRADRWLKSLSGRVFDTRE